MKELAKSVMAIAAIAIIVVVAFNHDMNGELAKYGILAIGAIALGADALSEWLESRRSG